MGRALSAKEWTAQSTYLSSSHAPCRQDPLGYVSGLGAHICAHLGKFILGKRPTQTLEVSLGSFSLSSRKQSRKGVHRLQVDRSPWPYRPTGLAPLGRSAAVGKPEEGPPKCEAQNRASLCQSQRAVLLPDYEKFKEH